MNRRRFIQTGALGLAAVSSSCAPRMLRPGANVSNVAKEFDLEVESFMRPRRIPGGALAVIKDRRLIYVRGYGFADRDKQVPVRPDSLFRIASISKPITAVAVLKLVEDGKIDLDAKAFSLIDPAILRAGQMITPTDARVSSVTVRQLLQHTGGWDRDKSFDPMFRSAEICQALGVAPGPAGPKEVIRYMFGQKLDFDPGEQQAYSNFGYCVLGRIIEKVAGQPYESHVRQRVMTPVGIRRMRIGRSLEGQEATGETRYYTMNHSEAASVFPGTARVPTPYGGFHLEAMDAHGGWIGSAVDLARFAAALDDPAHSTLLKAETFSIMYAPPPAPAARNEDGSLHDWWFGCGWAVRPVRKGKLNVWHSGSLPGTSTLLVRRWDGLSWVILFNQRSTDRNLPDNAIDGALHRAADAVSEWPDHDLFSEL